MTVSAKQDVNVRLVQLSRPGARLLVVQPPHAEGPHPLVAAPSREALSPGVLASGRPETVRGPVRPVDL